MVKSELSSLQELEPLLAQRRVSRASFLRLLGAGIGLSLAPTSLAALGGVSRAQTVVSASEMRPLLVGDEYPIGLFWPPPPDETTVERYSEIKDAGFNFVIGGNGVTDDPFYPPALQAAEANDLRFLLTDSRLRNIIERTVADAGAAAVREAEAPSSIMRHLLEQSEPEAATDADEEITSAAAGEDRVAERIQRLLNRYAKYPALGGLNLYDEPHSSLFGILAFARGELQRTAPEQLPYLNVWPSYASTGALGTPSYEEYLKRYMNEVQPPLLSFDHYPLLQETQITSDYFYNWAQIREYALKFSVPSWVFIQSVDFDWSGGGLARRRRPNEAELFWQANVSLAYGAKGIQYFTYWTPTDQSIWFGEALVSADGHLTPLYGYAKKLNSYLKVVGKALLPLTSESVVHAQEEALPRRAKACTGRDGWIDKVSGSPVILGRFYRSAEETERHLLVANRSFIDEAQTVVKLSNRVKKVFELDSETGEYVRVMWHANPDPRKLRLSIAPGGARLFLLQTG